MKTIHVDIVSAEGEIFSGEATMVFAPASTGEIGIAPSHAPLLTNLKAGDVRVQVEGQEEQLFYVSGGIQPHLITVLADSASRAEDLDEEAVLEAKRRAEEAIANVDQVGNAGEAHAELAMVMAQLKTLEKIRRQAKR